MKIFNWVHRRFRHKDELVGQEDAKSAEFIDKLALLENVAFDGVFDGWKEGILTIGTLGFDPLLKDFNCKLKDDAYMCEISLDEMKEYDDHGEMFIGDENNGNQEGEMEYPLVKHGVYHDHDDDHPQYCDEIAKTNDEEGVGMEDSKDLDIDQVEKMRKNGERITLADLFWAESEKNLLKNKKLADDDDDDEVKVNYSSTTTIESIKKLAADDDGVSFISKKKKLTKEDSARPIKKINRLMRKMLKRKIHPDSGIQKETARMKPIRIPAGSVNK